MLGKDIQFYKKTPQEIQAIIEYLIREKELLQLNLEDIQNFYENNYNSNSFDFSNYVEKQVNNLTKNFKSKDNFDFKDTIEIVKENVSTSKTIDYKYSFEERMSMLDKMIANLQRHNEKLKSGYKLSPLHDIGLSKNWDTSRIAKVNNKGIYYNTLKYETLSVADIFFSKGRYLKITHSYIPHYLKQTKKTQTKENNKDFSLQ